MREVRATRAATLARNGVPLATSVEVFDIYIDRRAWEKDPSRATKTAEGLAPLLGKDPATLLARLEAESDGPIELLETSVSYEIGAQIKDLSLPGVTVAEG